MLADAPAAPPSVVAAPAVTSDVGV